MSIKASYTTVDTLRCYNNRLMWFLAGTLIYRADTGCSSWSECNRIIWIHRNSITWKFSHGIIDFLVRHGFLLANIHRFLPIVLSSFPFVSPSPHHLLSKKLWILRQNFLQHQTVPAHVRYISVYCEYTNFSQCMSADLSQYIRVERWERRYISVTSKEFIPLQFGHQFLRWIPAIARNINFLSKIRVEFIM